MALADLVTHVTAGRANRPGSATSLPPVVLGRPAYLGTVAAIRDLAKDSIPTFVISRSVLDCGRWSRGVRAIRGIGQPSNPEALLRTLRLLPPSIGQAVLLPTCDTSAWTYAAFASELASRFCLYAPSRKTIETILDKCALHEACLSAGVAVPKSWSITQASDLSVFQNEFLFPLILKPRSHIRRLRNDKGRVIRNHSELLEAFSAMSSREQTYSPTIGTLPAAGFLAQEFFPGAATKILSISGFIDKTGTRFLAQGTRKLLLRSEPAGVGVCFETASVEEGLLTDLRAFLTKLSYFGVFEVEFVQSPRGWLLIDFNPRFFNQMGMDIARGASLARLSYYDAIGDVAALSGLLQVATKARPQSVTARDGFTMRMVLISRRVAGRLSRADLDRWGEWIRQQNGSLIDLVHASGDRFVWPIHVLSEVRLALRKLTRVTWGFLTERSHAK